MRNIIRNAWKTLEREGDPYSGHNGKLCKAAHVVAREIVEAINAIKPGGVFVEMDLPRGYRLEYGKTCRLALALNRELYRVAHYDAPNHRRCSYEFVLGLPPDGARALADDIATGLIAEIAGMIEGEYGTDAARKFYSALNCDQIRCVGRWARS